jgi:hypothetical protein
MRRQMAHPGFFLSRRESVLKGQQFFVPAAAGIGSRSHRFGFLRNDKTMHF